MHICICTYIYVFLWINSWVNIMLLLYVFRTESPSFIPLPAVLSVGLNLHGLFPIQSSIFVDIILVQITLWQPCWLDFMGIASDIIRRHHLTANSLIFWLSQSLHVLFCYGSWAVSVRMFWRCMQWDWSSQLFILIGDAFL